MNARQIFDLEVVGSSAWKIGKVKDLVVDTNVWQVTAIDVELEKSVAKEFNVKHRFSKTHIPLGVSQIQAVGDRILLKSSKEEIFQQVAAVVSKEEQEQEEEKQQKTTTSSTSSQEKSGV
jgi:sporulation protein YlmC with PRC-barrel domain